MKAATSTDKLIQTEGVIGEVLFRLIEDAVTDKKFVESLTEFFLFLLLVHLH